MSFDMGDVSPTAALGPSRAQDGTTTLGRLTTTDEQRAEVIRKMTAQATERRREIKARVLWSRGEPTILEVSFDVEHIEGEPVYLPRKVTEYTETGAEIPPNEEARLRILKSEVAELHERGML